MLLGTWFHCVLERAVHHRHHLKHLCIQCMSCLGLGSVGWVPELWLPSIAYKLRAQLIIQHVDAGQLNVPSQ